MKFFKGILVSVLSIGVLTGCGVSEDDQAKIDKYDELSTKYNELSTKYEELEEKYEAATIEIPEETDETNGNPKIGDYFEIELKNGNDVYGPLGVKVVSVKETDERPFKDEEDIEHIAVVEFEFTNKSGDSLDLYSDDFNVIDKEGFQGRYFYSGTDDFDVHVELPKDGKAKAYFRYEVGTPGPYSVQVGDIVVK